MRNIRWLFLMLSFHSIFASANKYEATEPQAVIDAIPPQPLADALQTWAQYSGWQLMYDSGLAVNRQSGRAPKSRSAIDSLTRVLEGTGLDYRFLNSRTVLILPAATLAELNKEVLAGEFREISHGEVQPSMTPADQEQSKADSKRHKNYSASKEMERIEEVLVTAQKREERLSDVPISISVVDGGDLDQSSLLGIGDALSKVPGVTVQPANQGAGTQLVVRGVSSGEALFAGPSPIAYYLDGVPVGLVKSAILPDTNAYDLDRIEVLKGPQGTLYGASSVNGVVRVLTQDADLNEFSFKTRSGASTTDNSSDIGYSGDMAINVPIVEGKLGARAIAGYQSVSGYVDNRVESDANDQILRSYRLKLNAQPIEHLSLGLSIWSSNNDINAWPISNKNFFYDGGAVPTWSDVDYDIYGFKLGYEFADFSLSSTSGYLRYKSDGQFEIRAIRTYLSSDFNSEVFSQEVLLTSKQNKSWKWSTGAYYRDGKDFIHQALPPFLPMIEYHDSSRSYAAFGEIGRRFVKDRLEWTLGLRYFHDDVTDGGNAAPSTTTFVSTESSFHATTPRAVLTWYPDEALTVYGSYSEGFRSGWGQTPAVQFAAPNVPPVKPDKLRNYEIGAKGDLLNDHLSLEAALYYMKWNDVQQLGVVFVNSAGFSAGINGKSASGFGVDLGVTGKPLDRLKVGASVSWNDLTHDEDTYSGAFLAVREGERLNYSSEYSAAASADYTIPFGQSGFLGTLSLSAVYNSEQLYLLINPNRPSTVNYGDAMLIGRVAFTLVAPRQWTAMLYADNVNNEHGVYAQFPSTPDAYTRPRPRTMGVQFNYSFE